MTRRRRTLLALGLLVVLAGVGVTWAVFGVGGPDEYRRIRIGMTQDEVSEVFGRGPDYGGRVHRGTAANWQLSQGMVLVAFDEHGKAWRKQFFARSLLSSTFRRWLGL